MRKLLTIENIPATKSEVTKDILQILGKSVVGMIGGYLVIFGVLVAIGLNEKKKLEASKEEK